MKTNTLLHQPGQSLERKELLILLEAGLRAGAFRWVRQTAVSWLTQFPGDLRVSYFQALAIGLEGRVSQAQAMLENLLEKDPEFLEVYQVYGQFSNKDNENASNGLACLTGEMGDSTPAWCKGVWDASQALDSGHPEEAEQQLLGVLGDADNSILAALVHLRIAKETQDSLSVARLAELYHQRWDKCLQFSLYLAEALMALGNEADAVKLLHQCAVDDTAAQVPLRLWGAGFAYLPLWQDPLEAEMDLAIPVEVAAELGMNRLAGSQTSSEQGSSEEELMDDTISSGEDSSAKHHAFKGKPQPHLERPKYHSDDTNRSVEREFRKIADGIKQPAVLRQDGRFPIFVILTTRQGLINKYGAQTAIVIEQEMTLLLAECRQRVGWGAMVFIPDDLNLMTSMGLKAADAGDPWQLKLALVDLDQALAKKGQMIGAVMIVGGPEVVPFHQLPNPTDDVDDEIPSDNPYGTLDSNYFVPEWAVGRLPGEAGPDAGLLINQLRNLVAYHRKSNRSAGKGLPFNFSQIWESVRQLVAYVPSGSSFGYTAAVWRRSSIAAFRPIGPGRSLRLSPPLSADTVDGKVILKSATGYFNLHGVADGPEWFGQRDPVEDLEGPDYPVALRPEDLKKNGKAPKVIFSEACYGGMVSQKSEQTSLALKFLSIGTFGVVASTVIAYGSVTSPLIGADLLGFLFWRYLRDGYTTGEALVQAKIDFVREMNRRQGFLDGEDQKTLLSFVLYGDPMVRYAESSYSSKSAGRSKTHLSVRTVCDRQEEETKPKAISVQVIEDVKAIVSEYLPGLEQSDISVSLQHAQCDGKDHRCPTADLGKDVHQAKRADMFVVTISKDVRSAHRLHHHYARVTVNGEGKVLKLAISR